MATKIESSLTNASVASLGTLGHAETQADPGAFSFNYIILTEPYISSTIASLSDPAFPEAILLNWYSDHAATTLNWVGWGDANTARYHLEITALQYTAMQNRGLSVPSGAPAWSDLMTHF